MSNLIRKEKTVNEKELLAKDSEEITPTDIPNEAKETQITTDSQQNNKTANPEKPKRATRKKTAFAENGVDGEAKSKPKRITARKKVYAEDVGANDEVESKPRRSTTPKKAPTSDTAEDDNASVAKEIPASTDIAIEKSDSSEEDTEKVDGQTEVIQEASGEFAAIFNVSSDSEDTYDSDKAFVKPNDDGIGR